MNFLVLFYCCKLQRDQILTVCEKEAIFNGGNYPQGYQGKGTPKKSFILIPTREVMRLNFKHKTRPMRILRKCNKKIRPFMVERMNLIESRFWARLVDGRVR